MIDILCFKRLVNSSFVACRQLLRLHDKAGVECLNVGSMAAGCALNHRHRGVTRNARCTLHSAGASLPVSVPVAYHHALFPRRAFSRYF